MKQYINNMEDIVIHTGTNDVGNLSTNEIVKNMENCLGKLKNRWQDARIGLSGLTMSQNNWFDLECETEKENLKSLGEQIS